jgi:hypothetical protein
MELKLYEKFILLAIDSQKERFTGSHVFLRYALAGAFLYDLYLQEKISLLENRIKVAKFRLSGDRTLDEVLKIINDSRKNRIVRHWIYKIGYRSFRLRKKILTDMSFKSMIRITDYRFLGIISYKKYRIMNPKLKDKLINDLLKVLLQDNSVDQENIFLAGLLDFWMMRKIFPDRNQRKSVRKRIRELIKQNNFSRIVNKAITRMVARHRNNGFVIAGGI